MVFIGHSNAKQNRRTILLPALHKIRDMGRLELVQTFHPKMPQSTSATRDCKANPEANNDPAN